MLRKLWKNDKGFTLMELIETECISSFLLDSSKFTGIRFDKPLPNAFRDPFLFILHYFLS